MAAPKPFGTQNALLASQGVDINALVASMVSRDRWTYYYTLSIPNTAAVQPAYALFNATAGQIDPYNTTSTLTKKDTNIPSPASSGFSAPKDLVLDSFGFGFSYDTLLSDQGTFMKNSFFEFKILDKVFFEGNLTMFPTGTGIYGFSDKNNEGVWQNGMPEVKNRVRLGDFAKYLAPLMQYSLTIFFPTTALQFTPTQAMTLYIHMNGLTDRPVA